MDRQRVRETRAGGLLDLVSSTNTLNDYSSNDTDWMSEGEASSRAWQSGQRTPSSSSRKREALAQEPPAWRETVDNLLVADFFFVCAALLWLVAGVVLKAQGTSEEPLNLWYKLWPVVFQPAIGVLMLGAIVSGLSGVGKKDA